MKDITFSGGSLDNSVTFRVDSISGHGNLTVMETYGLDDREQGNMDVQAEISLASSFLKLPGTLDAFKAFALANNLDLQVAETNGNMPYQLNVNLAVTAPAPGSSSNDTTPTFTGTGTPGASISILCNNVTSTTTVASNGTWSVTSAALSLGARSAAVTLTKGAASKVVTVAFTITA